MRTSLSLLAAGLLAGPGLLLAPAAGAAPAAPAAPPAPTVTISTTPTGSAPHGQRVVISAKAVGHNGELDGQLTITGVPARAESECGQSGGGGEGGHTWTASAGYTCRTIAVGSYTFAASYTGGKNYSPASATTRFTVTRAAIPTTTQLSASPSKSAPSGSKVTFIAVVAAKNHVAITVGKVAFASNGATIHGCGAVQVTADEVAKCTAKAPAPGVYRIRAAYGGTAAFASSSTTRSYTVTTKPSSVRGGKAPGSVRGGVSVGEVNTLAATGSRTAGELVLAVLLLAGGTLLAWAGRRRSA